VPVDPNAPVTTLSAALQRALQDARNAIIAKEKAMADGDWTAYGKADAALKNALDAAISASK
jgi:hypothetical protein